MLPITNGNKKLIPFYRDEYILRELKNGREYNEICDYFDNNCKEGMWDKLNKLIKPNGAIVLFGSEPFSSALRMSNIKNYKYDWKWDKIVGSGSLNCRYMPLKRYEDVCVFYKKTPTYNPIMTERDPAKVRTCGNFLKPNETYGLKDKKQYLYDEKLKYPDTKLEFHSRKNELNSKHKVHPTQKPVALMEYLIKTYTNENELVLDFTAGSFSTMIGCQNTNRKCIGIELDEGYFDIGLERVKTNANEG